MNAMQMLHGAFNIQNWQEAEEQPGLKLVAQSATQIQVAALAARFHLVL